MRLEDEIQQFRFRNEHQKLLINLFYTYNVLSSKTQDILKASNLTMQQFNILRILRGQHPNPATNNMVKERMLDKNSDVTRLVDRMVRDGFVTRTSCETDRRRVDISITEKGLKALQTIDLKAKEMDTIAAGLTEQEARIFNEMLDKLRSGTK
ncbi:MAG: MarR family transcriptional regulator [Bacteroidetes bacterium]|nr:MarR family transcriptional regulator [Bacteroidota bacterium]MCH8524339.1 MarR family transcriptional regulator [Balneolales bacterium]